ncbi:MAG: hypothetical protein CSB02_00335 [Bacteroidia bacterium]|nr:MAG: hypothetical protein CSB02_00335 [Bacteroidia bacterium]
MLVNTTIAQKLIDKQIDRPIGQSVPKVVSLGKAVGDDCSNPFVVEVDAVPFTYTDNQPNGTCGHGNSYDNDILEHYGDGEDVIYKVQVPQQAQINIDVVGAETAMGGYFHAVALYKGCPDTGELAGFATATIGTGELTLTQALEPDTEYFVWIDYWGLEEDPCLTSYEVTMEFTTDIVHLYNLYVADEQVTSENAANLSVIDGVTGTVNYDHDTKTLTLDNASITGVLGVKNESIEGLKINLVGQNTIISTSDMGACIVHYAATEISGDNNASLMATSVGNLGIYMFKVPLNIKNCTIETSGSRWGIAGEDASGENLIIDNATVKATGPMKGSIADIANLTLLNNTAITAPVGAAFDANLHGVAIADTLVKVQVVMEPAEGIQAADKALGVSVYPNPANDYIEVSVSNMSVKKLNLQVYDLLGKLVQSYSTSQQTTRLNIKDLEKGVYILKVGNATKRFVKK